MPGIARALDAGVPAARVAGDEVYGARPGLRAELEARGIGYVLAVARDHPVRAGGATQRADALLRCVPTRAWLCISAGKGAKGHRHYDWAFLWHSWYRWVTLAMLAHAFLVAAAVTERSCRPPPSGPIGLTCNQFQHLFVAVPLADPRHRLRWSLWRRRQARARSCHYRQQASRP
jgi:hypothetical protein